MQDDCLFHVISGDIVMVTSSMFYNLKLSERASYLVIQLAMRNEVSVIWFKLLITHEILCCALV